MIGFYFTMGKYDIVTAIDVPSDEAIANITVNTGSKGNARTETLKTFTEDQFRNIIEKI